MDLIKFFTRDEPIAGLEVSDTALRLTLLDRKLAQLKSAYIEEIAEEPLEEGAVQSGLLKDSAKFIAAFKALVAKSKTKINYVILSLPQSLAYSKLFYFPKVLVGDKLEDAMRAETQFNLPIDTKNIYLDWEKTPTGRNELFLETVPKAAVDPYTSALNSIRVQVVAVESRLLSLIRVIDIDHAKPTMLILTEENSTIAAIIKNQTVRFSRLLPKKISEADLKDEIARITDFYEVEDEPISKTIRLDAAPMVKKFADHEQIKTNPSAWLVAVGAALRGLLPRKTDTLISLLPIGTEAAYEYQKSVIFTKFMSGIVASLSILFTISFIAAWGLAIYLSINLGDRITSLAKEPIPLGITAVEERVIILNRTVSQLAEIIKKSPTWSKPLENLMVAAGNAVTVSDFQALAIDQELKIRGAGKTRNDIRIFEKNLNESRMYSSVKINIDTSDILKKENILFDATLRVRNPNQLYVQ